MILPCRWLLWDTSGNSVCTGQRTGSAVSSPGLESHSNTWLLVRLWATLWTSLQHLGIYHRVTSSPGFSRIETITIFWVWFKSLHWALLGGFLVSPEVTMQRRSHSGLNGVAWPKVVSLTCLNGAPLFSSLLPSQQARLGLFTQWSGVATTAKESKPMCKDFWNLRTSLWCPIGQSKSYGQAQIQRVEK